MKRKESGITLIALVVTIVVLLILAGVSISMLTGENGIITQAQKASVKNDNGTVLEALRLKLSQYLSENEGTYAKDKLELLRDDEIIDENNVIDVLKLVEQKLKTGNGSNNKDVYVIEDNHLYYYDNKGNKTDLGDLGNTEENIAETDPDFFEITDDGTISIKDKLSYYTDDGVTGGILPYKYIKIPSEINGIKVTKISDKMFGGYDWGFKNVETIIIPEGVTSIGEDAFTYCEGLKNIEIPEGVTIIGDYAFSYCRSLLEVTIPPSVEEIGDGVFASCKSLKNIEISEGVSLIGERVFSNCTSLSELIIPFSVTSIGKESFRNCTGLRTIKIYKDEGTISGEPWGAEESTEILYLGDIQFKEFATNYLLDKNQEELEELMLKSEYYIGTFEEFLNETNTTRNDLEQTAKENGMTYIEYLKNTLIDRSSWLGVEYEVSKNNAEGKTVEELEQMFVEKNGGTGSFDDLLAQEGMSREDFENMIKEQGFRTEEDFLKVQLFIN